MSTFVPNKVYLRDILLHYFIQNKSAVEAHIILVEIYGDNALSDTTCRDWFRCFKNNDFKLENIQHRPQNQITMVRSFFSVFRGISRV